MRSQFEIREATTADLQAIAEVNVAAGQAAYEHIVGREALETLEPNPENWTARFSVSSGRFVATEHGEVVGFAFTGPSEGDDGVGELAYFYTHPRVWGRGVGRALLAAAVEALRADGYEEAVLWTEERNHRPRRVYEAAGWRTDGAVKDRTWLGKPIREVRYRIRLR